MSIVVRFNTSNLTRAQYDSVKGALEQSGAWPPAGCQVHVCFGDENDLHVSEIWESREQLDAFGPMIGPHLAAANVQMSSDPDIFDAINVESF